MIEKSIKKESYEDFIQYYLNEILKERGGRLFPISQYKIDLGREKPWLGGYPAAIFCKESPDDEKHLDVYFYDEEENIPDNTGDADNGIGMIYLPLEDYETVLDALENENVKALTRTNNDHYLIFSRAFNKSSKDTYSKDLSSLRFHLRRYSVELKRGSTDSAFSTPIRLLCIGHERLGRPILYIHFHRTADTIQENTPIQIFNFFCILFIIMFLLIILISLL